MNSIFNTDLRSGSFREDCQVTNVLIGCQTVSFFLASCCRSNYLFTLYPYPLSISHILSSDISLHPRLCIRLSSLVFFFYARLSNQANGAWLQSPDTHWNWLQRKQKNVTLSTFRLQRETDADEQETASSSLPKHHIRRGTLKSNTSKTNNKLKQLSFKGYVCKGYRCQGHSSMCI